MNNEQELIHALCNGEESAFRKLYTWIYRVSISECSEHFKKQKAKKRFSFLTSLFGEENELVRNKSYFEPPHLTMKKDLYPIGIFYPVKPDFIHGPDITRV